MEQSHRAAHRRSRAQWAKLVAAWQRSGLTASAFARSHGVPARTLSWWKWRLSQSPSSTPRSPKHGPRLVAVRVEPERTSAPQPAWELTFAGGTTLRVHTEIAPTSLRALLHALGPARRLQ